MFLIWIYQTDQTFITQLGYFPPLLNLPLVKDRAQFLSKLLYSLCDLIFSFLQRTQEGSESSYSHGIEDISCGHLDHDALWSGRWLPMFQENVVPPSSGSTFTRLHDAISQMVVVFILAAVEPEISLVFWVVYEVCAVKFIKIWWHTILQIIMWMEVRFGETVQDNRLCW
jgi:hypothetical protein